MGGNLLPFSALMSPVCSTTASSAGPTSTPVRDESFTSRWSRKEPTVRARFTSDGTRGVTQSEGREMKHWLTGLKALLRFTFSPKQYNRVRNTVYNIYIYISFVAANHHKPQFFTKTPLTSQALTTLQLFCGTFIFSKWRFKKRLIFVGFFILIIFVCEI